jgi:tape measure domain-containing protein
MAQLELSVVLNLANFRTQLGKLAQASAAYYYPINLTIDKQAFKKQLAALGNIKTTLNINDSQIEAARARVGTLNKSLATLRRATSTAIEIKVKYKEEGRPAAGTGAVGRAITGRAAGEEALANKSRGELQKLYGLFREANLRVGELSKSLAKSSAEEIRQSLVPAFSDSGEEAVNGLAIGLKDPSSKVSKAAKRLTVITIQDVKKGFGIASPSRVFKEIGKDLVAGLEIGFEDFNELRANMVGKMRQLVSAIKKEVKVGGITMGGLLSPIARPTGASTRTLPGVVSPTRRGESADPGRGNQKILNSLSLLTGNPALYRGRMANLGAERLPSSLLGAAQSQFQLEELAPSFKQARLASGVSPVDKIIDEAFFGRGTLPKAQSALSTLSNSLERLGSTARAALPSGILQSASGSARMRRFGGVAPGESMGIFEPTARPTAYPPSGGFLEFSRRATAISAGLPGNVFGGRGGGASGGGGGGGGRGPGGGGVVPPGGFPVDGVAVTRNAKLGTVMDVAAASTRNFTASQVPLIGGLKNLAGEFGQAAKQVLLYGTAYKGLAFLTSLPGQILNAAKSQQQFANGLKVATQDTGTFAKELLYVDNVQRAFGLNLETTRTGFTRLYASMAPTGFDSGSIEKLFTGISAATASLQLTPDKAERVIYAFGQMASKGQIMSEELKGQLGDVLPGALAIFSKAAGMSVKEFSKAMEDGEFTGNRFREVFAKVSDELMNRFGTGAQAAGRSLQGLINTVGGDFTRTLQSFAPLANAAAQATLGPLTGILREVSMAAQIAMGEQDRVKKQLEAAQADVSALKTGGADVKEIKAAEQNVAALAAQYEVLNEAAKDPAIAQQVKNIEAFVIEIQKAATFTMNLAGVIGNVLSPVFTFLGGNLTSVIGNLALFALGFNAVKLAALLFTGTLATLNAIQKANGSISVIAAAKSTILAGVYRLVGVQATGAQVATVGFSLAVKGLLASTGIGLLVVLLGSLATAFLSVGNKAKEAADRAKRSIDSMVDAARTGNVSLIENELALNKADRQDLENFIKDVEGVTGKKSLIRGGGTVETITLTPAQRREAKRLGAEIGDVVIKESLLSSLKGQRAPLKEVETEGKDELALARRRVEQLGLNQPTPGATTPEDPSTGSAADKARQDAERLASQQQQAAIDAANRQNALDKSRFEGFTALREQAYQHEINLIDLVNEYRLNGLNSIEARQEKFQQDLQKIELKRIETVRKAQEQMQKAQIDYTAAQRTAGAAGAGSGNQAGGGAVFGDTGRTFNAKGWVHGHFQNMNKSALIEDTVDVVMKLLEQGVKPELSSGAAFGAGMGREQVTSLVRRGIESHKRYASGASAIDVFVPQGTPVPVPLSGVGDLGGAAGVTGSLARSTQLMHLDPKSKSGAARTMERRSAKAGGTAGVEQQDLLYKGMESGLSIINATTIALKERENLIAANINTIFPVAEQRLENDLMKMRNQLQLQGMPQEYIAFQEQQYKTTYEAAEAIKRKKQETMEYSKTVEALQAKQAQGKTLTSDEAESLRFYTEAIRQNDQALTDLIEKQRAYNIAALESAIASIKNADALKAQQDAIQLIDSNVESATGSYKNFIKEVAQGGDPAEALKKFQESITDQVLTVLLDYAFQPVEQFLKDSLKNMFGLPTEEKLRQEQLQKMDDQLKELQRSKALQTNIDKNVTILATGTSAPNSATGQGLSEATINQGFGSIGGASFGGMQLPGLDKVLENIDFETAFEPLQKNFGATLENLSSTLDTNAYSLSQSAVDYSANFKNVGDSAKKMAEDAGKAAEDAGRNGKDFQESLGKVASGIGIAAGAIMGIAAGISQIKKGGTGNTLMGIGSIMASVGGAIGGFTKLFGANGGVAGGGWKPFPVSAFANGGMVKGPTLGLVGEGKYNEAIVPLPDGRSIPVQMRGGGGSGSRDLLANQAQSRPSPSVLSMSFQSTTINGVEYVDRAQLEAAMEETRRAASREGASKGANLAIDRLANSPSSRRRVGIR